MSVEVLLLIGTLFVLAGIGLPIAYAIILASMVYIASGSPCRSSSLRPT